MIYNKEQLQERFDKLPVDVKAAVNSIDTTNAVVDIGLKHSLMYDQISELLDEVGLVMLGMVPSAMFVNDISRRMKVDVKKSSEIARDVNAQIFDKMRASLQKIEDGHEEKLVEENVAVAAPEKTFSGQGEQTIQTDAEKAHHEDVMSAVEKAGGFEIERPGQKTYVTDIKAPAIPVAPISKEAVLRAVENDKMESLIWPKAEPSLGPDHLLGDTPEIKPAIQAPIKTVPTTPKPIEAVKIPGAPKMQMPKFVTTNAPAPKIDAPIQKPTPVAVPTPAPAPTPPAIVKSPVKIDMSKMEQTKPMFVMPKKASDIPKPSAKPAVPLAIPQKPAAAAPVPKPVIDMPKPPAPAMETPKITLPRQPFQEASMPIRPAQTAPIAPKPAPETITPPTITATQKPTEQSIVDTLLSKGVATPMEKTPPAPTEKLQPRDGVDPYREPLD
jgi:hypothetical protein